MGLGGSIIASNSDGEDFHKDIYGRRIKDADVFFYPQRIKGVPVFDIDSVMKHYQKEIQELRRFVPIGDHQVDGDGKNLFKTMYLDVIYRFAEYIHLIPASEDHHHRGPGGLLIHSIQTAYKSMVFAENKKYKRSGFLDLDKEMAVRARYATWLTGLMHDTGKILRDIQIDAVEQIDGKGGTVAAVGVATWTPHLQTLIEWAKENKVATYSVSYVRHRTHNAHNLDSSHLLPYILGRSYAMKYLVEAPCENLYSEVSKILSGLESDSYISRAVKEGDAYSTMKDMSVYHDIMTGVKNKSVGSRVVMLMKMAKAQWEWNTPGGEGWIIGGHCYIRWPNAIQSIVKESIKHGQAIPHDNMALVVLMENNGLIKRYDDKHRALKFAKGQYSEEEVADIAAGRKAVPWEELIRITWDGHLFDDDPRPNNCKGVLYLPESGEYIAIDRMGNTRFIIKEEATALPAVVEAKDTESTQESESKTKNAEPKKNSASPPAAPKEATSRKKQKASEKPAVSVEPSEQGADQKKLAQSKPVFETAEIDTSKLDTATENAEQSKGIVFTRNKQKRNSETESPSKPELASKPEPKESVAPESIQLPDSIKALMDKGAAFWAHDGAVYIEVDQSKGIGAEELKAIKKQYLEIDQGAVAALAKNVTIAGRTFLAAKMKTPIAKALTAAGVVSTPAQVNTSHVESAQTERKAVQESNQGGESTKDAHSKKPGNQAAQQELSTFTPEPESDSGMETSLEDTLSLDAAYQASLDMADSHQQATLSAPEIQAQPELEPAPLEYMTEPAKHEEGTLGWILEAGGVDTSLPHIAFSKAKVKEVIESTGRKVIWTKIESTIRSAGFKVEGLEGDVISVEQSALLVRYWKLDNE